MSFMKGDLLTKTRKLVKGLAAAEPVWLKAMEKAPPANFPRAESKLKPIILPEDPYIGKFFQNHPDAKYEDPIKISGFDPPAARIFAWRVLELKEQGANEEEALLVADMEYRSEKKGKKKAYARLKQIARLQGKRPPPNPYPSAVKEIQAEEKKFVHDRFYNPLALQTVQKLKQEREQQMRDRRGGGGFIEKSNSPSMNQKPYPGGVQEIQSGEKKFVPGRLFNQPQMVPRQRQERAQVMNTRGGGGFLGS